MRPRRRRRKNMQQINSLKPVRIPWPEDRPPRPYESFRIMVDVRKPSGKMYKEGRLGKERIHTSFPGAAISVVYDVWKQPDHGKYLYTVRAYTYNESEKRCWDEYDDMPAHSFEEACDSVHERALQILMEALDVEYKRAYYALERVKKDFIARYRQPGYDDPERR